MNTSTDNVLVTLPQIVEGFQVSAGAVRAWIAGGRLVPVRREGRGRSGTMYFARGAVAVLVYGVCPSCGGGFKRSSLSQVFCSRLCRDRQRRAGVAPQCPQDRFKRSVAVVMTPKGKKRAGNP